MKKTGRGKWFFGIMYSILGCLSLAIAVDFGKHYFLKCLLEEEYSFSGVDISIKSISLRTWPLLQNHVILNKISFKSQPSRFGKSSFTAEINQAELRQGWQDWRIAHLNASDITLTPGMHIDEINGTVNIYCLPKVLKISKLDLLNTSLFFPLVALSIPQAYFDILYDFPKSHILVDANVPKILSPDGLDFGLNGQGEFIIDPALKGEMPLKIRNIHKLAGKLTELEIFDSKTSQGIAGGSRLLKSVGIQDITLTLRIKNEAVFLGSVKIADIKY